MNLFKFMINLATQSLIEVLKETEQLLSLKGNDFVWSPWNNAQEANALIRSHIEKLEAGDYSQVGKLNSLFAPTGAIQEVSVSSGWGEKFLSLAEQFDRAFAAIETK